MSGEATATASINSYRDLRVWQVAMDVAEKAYELTKRFPNSETYGLTSQARRAAVSVAANIAEGYGRDTNATFVNFLRISQGSLKELETLLLLSARIGLTEEAEVAAILHQCDELGRMMRALIRSLQRKAEREG